MWLCWFCSVFPICLFCSFLLSIYLFEVLTELLGSYEALIDASSTSGPGKALLTAPLEMRDQPAKPNLSASEIVRAGFFLDACVADVSDVFGPFIFRSLAFSLFLQVVGMFGAVTAYKGVSEMNFVVTLFGVAVMQPKNKCLRKFNYFCFRIS